MPVNWSDKAQIDNFRTVARSKGVDKAEIDRYIKQKSTGSLKQPTLEPVKQLEAKPMSQPMMSRQIMSPNKSPGRLLKKPTQEPTREPTFSPTPTPRGRGRVTQKFGNPNAGLYGRNSRGRANINRGVDVAAGRGQEQFAPDKGKWTVQSVDTSGWNTGWGNTVVIKNKNTGETIRRSHFDKVLVRPGQEVTGKVIGTTGRTGRTTGYHQDIEYTNSRGQLSDYTKSQYY